MLDGAGATEHSYAKWALRYFLGDSGLWDHDINVSTEKVGVSVPTRKRKSKKKLDAKSRMHDADKWLSGRDGPHDNFISRYVKRYGVSEYLARDELYAIGRYEDVYAEDLKAQGIDYEFIVNPLTGDMVMVPEGTEEHEIFMYPGGGPC